jgi:hemerythrin
MNSMQDVNVQMKWRDTYVVGYGPMDHIHEEFVDIVGQMQTCADEDLSDLLQQFISHAKAHFEEENNWMIETQFPPRACHIDQHNAVLNSAMEVQQLLMQGDYAMCRKFVHALVDWFPNHTDHLDSALAHWMFKRSYGGKPVVFRKIEDSQEA